MFSVKHVLDFLNLLLVLLPGLLVFLAAVVWSRRREVWSRPDGIYLLLLTIPPLVTVFMLNPTLGMPRDWDLFSFTGIPLNLLFYYTALNAPWEPKAVRIVAWLGVALGVIGLAPRVASQAVPQVGTALFDAYANLDPVRSRSGRYWELKYFDEQGDHDAYQAHARANRVALPHETWVNEAVDLIREGQVSDARTLLEQAIDYAPNYPYAWSNLGTIYEQDGRYDSALVCFMIADALQPFNAVVYDNTAKVFADLEKYGQAERYWRKALAVDSVHYSAALSLVRLWDRQGEAGKLDSALTALRTDDSLPLDIVIGFTALEVERSDWPGARYWLARAVLCGADTASVRKLREAHPELNPQP